MGELRKQLRLNQYIPHFPTPKQAHFLLLQCREALYGGAAGGGKSDALLMAALQYVDVPGYSALLLRRSFADLNKAEGLIPRSQEWLGGTDAKWNEQKKLWTFPSGAVLQFGYIESNRDLDHYQGPAFQFVGWDELTQHPENRYRYLFSRLRRLKGSPVPLRMRSSSNPGGVGHSWVKARFITEGAKKQRVFVRAKLTDNPYLDQESYKESLQELDPVTLAQLLNGDWDIVGGGDYFKKSFFEILPKRLLPKKFTKLVRYWDLASTEPSAASPDPDWTVGALVGEVGGIYYLLDIQRFRKSPAKTEEIIKATALNDGYGVPIWLEIEGGASGKITISHYTRNVLKGFICRGDNKNESKESRAKPVSSAAENSNVKIAEAGWNSDLLDELEAFPNGAHDDQVDAISGAFKCLRLGTQFQSA